MPSTAPDPDVVAAYARDALQNARDMIEEAEILMGHGRWARPCSLAVLASEEASKVWLCALVPMLPPDEVTSLFAWPFSEMNKTHGLKLGIAGLVTHMTSYLMSGGTLPGGPAPAEQDIEAASRRYNELKLRGLYVGYRDGKIQRPAELSEHDATEAVARATMIIRTAEDVLRWTMNLPPELLAVRETNWAQAVEAYERGGYEELIRLGTAGFENLTAEDFAQARERIAALVSDEDDSDQA